MQGAENLEQVPLVFHVESAQDAGPGTLDGSLQGGKHLEQTAETPCVESAQDSGPGGLERSVQRGIHREQVSEMPCVESEEDGALGRSGGGLHGGQYLEDVLQRSVGLAASCITQVRGLRQRHQDFRRSLSSGMAALAPSGHTAGAPSGGGRGQKLRSPVEAMVAILLMQGRCSALIRSALPAPHPGADLICGARPQPPPGPGVALSLFSAAPQTHTQHKLQSEMQMLSGAHLPALGPGTPTVPFLRSFRGPPENFPGEPLFQPLPLFGGSRSVLHLPALLSSWFCAPILRAQSHPLHSVL